MISPHSSPMKCTPSSAAMGAYLQQHIKLNFPDTQSKTESERIYPGKDFSKGYEIGIAFLTKDSDRHDPLPLWALAVSETGHTFGTSSTTSLYTIRVEVPCSDNYKQEYTREVKLVHDKTTVSQKRKLVAIHRLGFVLTEDVPRQKLIEFLVMFSPNKMDDMPVVAGGLKVWTHIGYVLRLIHYLRLGRAEKEGASAPCFRLEVDKMGKPVSESNVLPKPVNLIKGHFFDSEVALYDQIMGDWIRFYRAPPIEVGQRVTLFRV
ncbi:hypothetical protein BJ165DRAFT_1532332 [Panaeolus papilionaceus]|nr:hypothetical protein BJ165DRAFT_1532332 [Panaeolus papilionaceus]